MNHTSIIGTGSYVPANIVSNATFEKIVDTSDEWIRTRTGIENRHISINENTSDLAYEASVRALDDARLSAERIDLIICATVTPDYFIPGVSQILQRRLGCDAITAFDINAACTGFIYALEIADKMLGSGDYENALVIGAETLSKFTDFSDRNTCVLFADAAGAMVLTRGEKQSIKKIVTHAWGDLEGFLRMETYPLKQDFLTVEDKRPFIRMNGREIFKFATRVLPETIRELLALTGYDLHDLDLIIAHQANKRIIDHAAKVLAFPPGKMYVNIDRYGNTSAASVPLAIDEAKREGRLAKGELFATVAFGAGLTWGGAIIEL